MNVQCDGTPSPVYHGGGAKKVCVTVQNDPMRGNGTVAADPIDVSGHHSRERLARRADLNPRIPSIKYSSSSGSVAPDRLIRSVD